MRKDLADVTLIVDRSGSMLDCQIEAENGINHFVEKQKLLPGDCNFTLVQFDDEYEVVHQNLNVKDVPVYKLIPRGMTALLDAVGRTINDIGTRLDKLNDEDKPGVVICVIVTDGQENSSHEFTKPQIKEMITRQKDTYQWQFIFLGANQDAFAEAAAMGIPKANSANYNTANSYAAYNAVNNNVSNIRCASLQNKAVDACFSDEDRNKML
jgi:uncharacterized protein YegL